MEINYITDKIIGASIITSIDEAQLINYLKISNLQVGLLLNFHNTRMKDGIKRLVNNYVK